MRPFSLPVILLTLALLVVPAGAMPARPLLVAQSVSLGAGDYIQRGIDRASHNDVRGMNENFDKALQLAPNSYQVYVQRGYARAMLKDYKGAVADQTAALRLKPDVAEAYANRGTSRYRLGEREQARADWRKAAQIFRQKGADEQAEQLEAVLRQYK
ncbi:tetratricopeptide repeat protein [Gloeobacter kilaueensis]|uniref:TPR repeat protein n=1 Tax=Gloeobacter kilaueensis (strain ATCC BAA-2537 / CCAP 1431/1 / ULC 316 / JS1) TaxID=1183438 RepID=U5QBT9_GLOK1|nr:hypothetical protein [Gloeobacter kilaueensis]AGY56342.1 TPR repeat protein [Gloeobacter kilaueensis JS1]